MMFQALQSLLPIIFLVLLGAGLRWREFLDDHMRAGMDKFIYWVALPCLFIHKLAATDFAQLDFAHLSLAMVVSALVLFLVAIGVAALLRVPGPKFGVFTQASFRGNLAFVGLPLVIFALSGRPGADTLVATALVTIAALIPVGNALSVLALLGAAHSITPKVLPRIGRELVSNPLILSALLGIVLGWMGWRLPVVIDRPVELLGQTAPALALVSLGGALIALEVRRELGLSALAGVLKVALLPAITWGICRALNISEEQTFVALILAACPSATASYILTVQLGGSRALAATCVVVSTVLSVVSLSVVLVAF